MAKSEILPAGITIEVRDTCWCLHVQRAARAMARRYDDALRPVGLTNGQFSLLMALHRAAPPNMAEVAKVLAMDRTTLTANLKPLERRGLLHVSGDAADKRVRRIALTAEGRRVLAAALPRWRTTQAAILRLVTAPRSQHLRTGLRALS